MKTQLDYMNNMWLRYDARFRSFCKTRDCEKCEFKITHKICLYKIIDYNFGELIKNLEVFENEQKGPFKF